jgi:5,10-methylenetetrahydrofolate reductase
MTFQELLEKRTFVVTTEIILPTAKNSPAIAENFCDSLDWADLIRVKGGPQDRSGNHVIAACRAVAEKHARPELEVRTHTVNRLEIGKTMMAACDAGVENFLIFAQDYRISGDSMREMMYFHADMGKFFSVADTLARGIDMDGQKLDTPKNVLVGAGIDTQFGKDAPDLQMRELEKLAEHGVRYFVTNPIFDPDKLAGFIEKTSRLNVPVIAEVLMLQSAAEALQWHSLSWINVPAVMMEKLEKVGNSADGAMSVTIDIVSRLKGFCAGVHLLPYGDVGRIAREIKPKTT